MKIALFILLSLSGLWPASVQGADELSKIWKNNQAVKLQMDKKTVESFDEFAMLLGEEPFHPLFQYNMGTAFVGIEDVDKAKKLFEQLRGMKNLHPNLSFPVAYNLGVLYGLEKEVDKALEAYQEALRYQPDSNEIKTNIELLIQQKKGGGGKSKDKKDKGDKGKDQKKDPSDKNKDEEDEPDPNAPRKNRDPEYKGKDMSKGDVKKILDELRKQEQKIRAKHDRKGKKEKDRGKNW